MNTPWILWIIAIILYFAYFEARAFRHPDRQNTLSRAVYDLGRKWPLSIFIMGMLVGGLAVHFFWHWCPEPVLSVGNLRAHDLMYCTPKVFTATNSFIVSNNVFYWSECD